MKNTKLFSALLCGTVILAGCSKFTGTDNTFEKDIQEKYKNSDDSTIIENHETLTVDLSEQFTIGDTNSEGEALNYKAKLKFSSSMKDSSLSGITMDAFEVSDDKTKPFTCTPYSGFTASFDLDDLNKETVILTVTGDKAPESFIITVNAATVESVAGQKLDKDDDKVWGEKEDNVFFMATTTDAIELNKGIFTPTGYFLTGRETIISTFKPSGSVTDDKLTVTANIMNPENKSIVDAAIIIEKYDVATDSWSILNGNESTCSDAGMWEKEYEVKSYVPLRIKVKGLNDLKLKNSIGLELPMTTHDFLKFDSNDYEFCFDISGSSPYYDGYYDPTNDDISGDFDFNYKGNGVYEITLGSYSLPSWSPDSTTNCVTTEFTGWTVPEGSVKVFLKGLNKKLYEVKSEVSVVNEKTLRISLKDTEAPNFDSTLDYKYIVTASKDVKVNFKGTKDGEDAKFSLSLGHLCEASATYTLKGTSIIALN